MYNNQKNEKIDIEKKIVAIFFFFPFLYLLFPSIKIQKGPI
jgi:hypothetical protein